MIVAAVLGGATAQQAVETAFSELALHPARNETAQASERARELASTRPDEPRAPVLLGEGWVAEEALAMSVCFAFGAKDLESSLLLAVNHSGDSDSTVAIKGNMLGGAMGMEAIPERWWWPLPLGKVIEALADDLWTVRSWRVDNHQNGKGGHWCKKYPGG